MSNKNTTKLQATCSVCFRTQNLNSANEPIRHGFNAINIQHGTTGGWHTGPCGGVSFPHFGISTAGTEWALSKARAYLASLQSRRMNLDSNPELVWNHRTYKGSGRYLTTPITVQPGAGRDYTTGQPSYEELKERAISEIEREIVGTTQDIDTYTAKIAAWQPADATPAPVKAKIVHKAANWKGRPGIVTGRCQMFAMRPPTGHVATTENKDEVTCARCRAQLTT